jgi:hypothetical protein
MTMHEYKEDLERGDAVAGLQQSPYLVMSQLLELADG